MNLKILCIFTTFLGLSACAGLQRDPRSGYDSDNGFYRSTTDHFYKEQSSHKLSETKKELGFESYQLTDKQRLALNNRIYLKKLEKTLKSKRAKKQYYHYKPFIPTDYGRIQFLKLPSIEARDRWVHNNGYVENSPYNPSVNQAIEKNDVILGMTKKAVLESWGDPDLVEVAGNPLYGNERWRYKRMISSEDGYSQEVRLIQFEGGRVAGWEKY